MQRTHTHTHKHNVHFSFPQNDTEKKRNQFLKKKVLIFFILLLSIILSAILSIIFFFSLKIKKSPHILVYIINIFCFFVHILTRQKNCFTIGSIFLFCRIFGKFVYKY